MKDKKLTILVILIIIAIISLTNGIKSFSKKTFPASASSGIAEQKGSPVPAAAVERHSVRSRFASWGKNPFTLKAESSITLNGIMWDKVNPKAAVNGAIVRKGDKVENNTVVDIKPDRVILNNGTENIELKLEQ